SAAAPSALGTYTVAATINDTNYTGSANGTLTITAQPVLSVAAVAVPEGNSGTSLGTLNAVLSTASTSTITVEWAASAGSATASTDFTVGSGTLTFAPGDLSKPIAIPIIGDTTVEADETVIVTLSNPQLVALDATTAVLTITNDDANTAPVIAEGAAAAVTCDEDNTPAFFALTLHGSDSDAGQVLTWSIASAPSHGTVASLGSGATQSIAYLPTANFSGTDSFTVQVADGFGGSATCVVTVTVAPRNDAPTLTTAPVVTLGVPATATAGSWSDATDTTPGTITTAFQWQRADDSLGTNVSDLTSEITASHTLTAADRGKYLRVQVSASDDGEGLPAVATTVAFADFVLVPSGAGGSGGAGSSGGGGGGCGLGGSVTSLLGLALLMLRRNRLN
ncbi:MAG TPA: Ig-like domain-containing protein, partial [Planctomycetota bacterium]|nr:Ig-like domain-containing protein [Planctomycetota bacterium]